MDESKYSQWKQKKKIKSLNCINQEFSVENSVDTNVCADDANNTGQEISNDSASKILNSPNISDCKILKSEECCPAYQCDNLGSIFVDVGSGLQGSDFLSEEDEDISEVGSEILFTDHKDDYHLIESVKLEQDIAGDSKKNETIVQNLSAGAFNINDICTNNIRPGLSTNATVCNVYENPDDCDKPNDCIDYSNNSKAVSVAGDFEQVNITVKVEEDIEDEFEHQNSDEEETMRNDSFIDAELHSVSKIQELPGIDENNIPIIIGSNSNGLPDNCNKEIITKNNFIPHKQLKITQTALSETETNLQLQNEGQTLNCTLQSDLQINLQTNSRDYRDKGDECINTLENIEVERKNKKVCQNLRNEKSKHTTDRRYICEICSKGFKKLSNLKDHKRTHTGDRPFGCDICGKAFTTPACLKRHKLIHSEDKMFSCSVCGKVFTQLDTLKVHNRLHTGDMPFGCNVCGKAFTRQSSLQRHNLIHNGDRPFGCSICGKAFTQYSTLKTHERIHTGDRPFGCSVCGKAFTQHSALSGHKRIHTGDKPFACSICGKTFIRLVQLTDHKRVHTGDRPFSCSVCMKAFTRQDSLQRHKCIIHTGEKPMI